MNMESNTLRSRCRKSHDCVVWLVITLVMAVISSDALATTIAEVTFGDMCCRAESIFSGTCVGVESRRDVSSDKIYTYTRFEDVEWVHGESGSGEDGSGDGGSGDGGSTFELRTFGGEVDGERLTVHGMPRFEVGKRYVLFVKGNYRNVCPVIGWRQGCFRLEKSGATGGSIVSDGGTQVMNLRDGVAQAEAVPEYDTVVSWDGRKMNLAAFLEIVRAGRSAADDRETASEAGGQP